MVEAVNNNWTHYAPWNGDPELRDALAAAASHAGRHATTDNVLVTHGGSGALTAAIMSLVEVGDRVLIPEPTYSLYADLVRYAGGQVMFIPPGRGFHLDIDRLRHEAAIGARAVVLCHPCNPTGVVYSPNELRELAYVAHAAGIWVIVDEAYSAITYPDTQFHSTLEFPELADHLVYCQTFSKTYAMTGWRLGYLIAHRPIVDAAARVHRTFNGAINTAVQRAGLAALSLDESWYSSLRETYEKRRRATLACLTRIPEISYQEPDAAFYFFIHVPGIHCEDVLKRAAQRGLAIRAGNEFGPTAENYIRLTFAVGGVTLDDGLRRFGSVLDDLTRDHSHCRPTRTPSVLPE
jgi:aspartate aminotransferase